jgi:hypothetical protein
MARLDLVLRSRGRPRREHGYTFLLPGIAQVYWISAKWPATGTLSHRLTRMCVLWLCLFGIWLLALRLSGVRREPVRN